MTEIGYFLSSEEHDSHKLVQAAATTQQLFGGRFALGLGSGEALMSAICQHTSLARPCAA